LTRNRPGFFSKIALFLGGKKPGFESCVHEKENTELQPLTIAGGICSTRRKALQLTAVIGLFK